MNKLTISVKTMGEIGKLFNVVIDPSLVEQSVQSDAIYHVRASQGLWNTSKYTMRVECSSNEVVGQHGEVTEVTL